MHTIDLSALFEKMAKIAELAHYLSKIKSQSFLVGRLSSNFNVCRCQEGLDVEF
jgi:hypothetical protein